MCCFQQLGVESQPGFGTKTHRGRKAPAVQRREYQKSVAQQDRSNTARLETYAAVSECGQQSPRREPATSESSSIAQRPKSLKAWVRSPTFSVSGLSRKRKTTGLTSRLWASSRAADLECLIGREALRKYPWRILFGWSPRATQKGGGELVASAERSALIVKSGELDPFTSR